ncbi:hypothetical protein ACHAWF_015499 [Thalassiosira exigua]
MSAAASDRTSPSDPSSTTNGGHSPKAGSSENMTPNGAGPRPPPSAASGSGSGANNAAPSPRAASATATVKQRRPYRNGTDGPRRPGAAGSSGGARSGGGVAWGAECDAAYCAEVARRSAARAALHLGLEGMEGAALDTLGSVLLGYMEQVGATISENVECSGRTSAHASAYDALNAVECCTAPAATQIAGPSPSESLTLPDAAEESSRRQQSQPDQSSPLDSVRLKEGQGLGWEGLASFLFGPEWASIPLPGDDLRAKVAQKVSAGTKDDGKADPKSNGATKAPVKKPGGKTVLPPRPKSAGGGAASTKAPVRTSGKGKQLLANMAKGADAKSVSFVLGGGGGDKDSSTAVGAGNAAGGPAGEGPSGPAAAAASARWHAPHPGRVPPFPRTAAPGDVANPHRLPAISFHDLATEAEACREVPGAPASKRARTTAPTKGASKPLAKAPTKGAKSSKAAESAARAARKDAARVPEEVYEAVGTTLWGSVGDRRNSSSDVKTAAGAGLDGDKKLAAYAKKPTPGVDGNKVTFDASSKPPSTASTAATANAVPPKPEAPRPPPRPSHVPNFFPPYPPRETWDPKELLSASVANAAIMGGILSRVHSREKRKFPLTATGATAMEMETTKVSTSEGGRRATAAAASERDAVRRSVVGLGRPVGRTHWGSQWLEDDEGRGEGTRGSRPNDSGGRLSDVRIAPGEGAAASAGGGGAPAAASAKKPGGQEASQVVPLGRASGSRLSKILEGSMNLS